MSRTGRLHDGRRLLRYDLRAPALPGAHNAQNAAAAACAWRASSACRATPSRARLTSFPGLPHRQQRVAHDRRHHLHQRQQGDQRRCRRACAGLLRPAGVDRRRHREARRDRAAGAILPPHRARTADRPRRAATSPPRSPRMACRTRSSARWKPPCPPRSPPRARTGAPGRAAVAGLRELGPVHRLSTQRGDRFAELVARARAGKGGLMPTLSRADNSLLGRWWWTVDRWTLGAIGVLIGFGYIMMLAASPAVAERIGDARDMFILKQVLFLALAGAIVVGVSLLSPRDIRRLAHRRLHRRAGADRGDAGGRRRDQGRAALDRAAGHGDPAERVPEAVLRRRRRLADRRGQAARRASPAPRSPSRSIVLIALLLKSQPDIGMLAVITAVFFAQLYVDGLNLFLVGRRRAAMLRRRRLRRLHVVPARAEPRAASSCIPARPATPTR